MIQRQFGSGVAGIARGAPLPHVVNVGFVGRRLLMPYGAGEAALLQREGAVAAALDTALRRIEEKYGAGAAYVAISPLALGGDLAFAEAVRRRAAARGRGDWLHLVFLPMPPDLFFEATDFVPPSEAAPTRNVYGERAPLSEGQAAGAAVQLARARALLESPETIEVRVASRASDRRERFMETGYEVAAECDVLIALETGIPWATGDQSETNQTVEFARRNGRSVVVIRLDDSGGFSLETPEHCSFGSVATHAGHFGPPTWFFNSSEPLTLAQLQFASLTAQLKALGSEAARNIKFTYERLILASLVAHVGATGVAAGAMLQWIGEKGAAQAKIALLLVAIGAPMLAEWQHKHIWWASHRLLAEICRSAQSLTGFPGSLKHLRDFHLPDWENLLRVLNVLHARDEVSRLRKLADPARAEAIQAFCTVYCRDRLGDRAAAARALEIGRIGESQSGYFALQRKRAELQRLIWLGLFLTCSLLAIAGPIAYLAAGLTSDGYRWFTKFLPLVLPVASAAIIGGIALKDLDRRADRYASMLQFVLRAHEQVQQACSAEQVMRRVCRIEHTLLQEVVEWYAKVRQLRL